GSAVRVLAVGSRNRLFERALARLSRLGGKAARVLGKLLDNADPRIRLGAAKAILDSGKTLSEFFGLVKRIEALEADQRAWHQGFAGSEQQGLAGSESTDTSEGTGDAFRSKLSETPTGSQVEAPPHGTTTDPP